MKTGLHIKGNAVLSERQGEKIVAIISCPKKGDIAKKVEQAILEDLCLTDENQHYNMIFINSEMGEELILRGVLYFSAHWIQDGEEEECEYVLTVAQTY